jgi:hypothetical protein
MRGENDSDNASGLAVGHRRPSLSGLPPGRGCSDRSSIACLADGNSNAGVYTGERSLFEYRDRLRSVMDAVDPDPGDAWIIDPKGGQWTLLHDEYRAYVDTHVPRQLEDMWWGVTSCLERARAFVSSDTLPRPMMIDTDVEVSRWVAGVTSRAIW